MIYTYTNTVVYIYHFNNLYFLTLQHIVKKDLKLEQSLTSVLRLKIKYANNNIVGTFHHGQGLLEKLQSTNFLASGYKDMLIISYHLLL